MTKREWVWILCIYLFFIICLGDGIHCSRCCCRQECSTTKVVHTFLIWLICFSFTILHHSHVLKMPFFHITWLSFFWFNNPIHVHALKNREKELASVKINPADVEVIANELEVYTYMNDCMNTIKIPHWWCIMSESCENMRSNFGSFMKPYVFWLNFT